MKDFKLEQIYKIRLAQQGKSEIIRELKESYIGLILIIMKKYFSNTIFSNTELFMVGNRALEEAITNFNTKESESFVDYANICIYNSIVEYMSKSIRYRFDNIIQEEPSVIMPKEETEQSATNELLLRKNQIKGAINILTSPLERKVLSLKLGVEDGINHNDLEIADILGIDQHRVSIIIDNALCSIDSIFYLIKSNISITKK